MGRDIIRTRRKKRLRDDLWEAPKWLRKLVDLKEDCTKACMLSHNCVPPCTTTSFFCATNEPYAYASLELLRSPTFWSSCSHICFCRFHMFLHSIDLYHHYLLQLLWDDDCILLSKKDLGHRGVNVTDVQNQPHPSTSTSRDIMIVLLYRRHYCCSQSDDALSEESPNTYKLCEFHNCNIVFRKRDMMAVRFCSLSCKIKHYDGLKFPPIYFPPLTSCRSDKCNIHVLDSHQA